jgi:hypothetical protein
VLADNHSLQNVSHSSPLSSLSRHLIYAETLKFDRDKLHLPLKDPKMARDPNRVTLSHSPADEGSRPLL